jgi:hypothetical protein
MQWGATTIAAPTGPSTATPAMFVGLDGADAAVLRPIAVGVAGGVSALLSIYGMTRDVSDNGLTPTGQTTLYIPQFLCSYASLNLGTSGGANAYGQGAFLYYDRLLTESVTGSVGTLRRNVLGTGSDFLEVHSPGSGAAGPGIAEIYLSNLGGFDLLAIGLALVQVSGTVSLFNMLANLRNGGT